MEDIKVSVIMPVYNVCRYIGESVKSVCEQNFSDYELILVDDGCLDDSIQVAEEVLKDYSLHYQVLHKKNGGLPSARNAGLAVARGKYVCFIDSDDIIGKNHLKNLHNLNEMENQLISYCDFELTYEDNRFGSEQISEDFEIIDRENLIWGFLKRDLRIHCCSLMLNLQYLKDNGYVFNEILLYGEDIEFMWRLFPEQKSVGHVKVNSYKYLQRTNSLMTAQSIDKVLVLLDAFKELSDKLMKKYPKDKKILKFLYGKGMLAFIRTFAESSDYSRFKELLDKVEYRKEIKNIISFPKLKIRGLAAVLYFSPRMFSVITKRIRETAN